MSIFSRAPSARLTLVAEIARQLLIAGAAAAGILAVAGGCGGRPPQPAPTANGTGLTVPSHLSPPSSIVLDEYPPQDGAGNNRTTDLRLSKTGRSTGKSGRNLEADAATAYERERLRRTEADSLMGEAMAPAPAPTASAAAALRAADRAVAPLADTLAAIESAQKVVVENVRNVETAGFKASRTAVGDGRDVASQIDPGQGELVPTQRALDVAIQGEGFLQITVYTPEHPGGTTGFTRNGKLYMNRAGEVVVGQVDGYQLLPPIKLPPGATQVQIDQDGRVTVTQAGADDPKPTMVGQIHLARFTDPTALRPLGGGIYAESESSGQAVESPANDRGAGAVIQGHLEASNVDLVRERMRLRFLTTWRATIISSLDGETTRTTSRGAQSEAGQR